MNYDFHCYTCELEKTLDARAFHPPSAPSCPSCNCLMDRVFGCEIDTSGCKDVDDVPEMKSVSYGGEANISRGQAAAIEAKHQQGITERRKDLRDGGNRGSIRQTMQIPAPLYHSKIKQTGDKKYWDDPKNRNRHKSCKVD